MQYTFEAIGTHWQLDCESGVSEQQWQQLVSKVLARIEEFDQTYSRFRDDSLVMGMARHAGTYKLPADAEPMIKLYHRLYELTGGLFTPLIGNLLAETGYDAAYSLMPQRLHAVPSWETVLEFQPPVLTLTQPALLDFGAAGKGYLVDLVSELVAAAGIRNYCVDGSGDIYYHSATRKSLRVGLEHPKDPTKVIGVAEITNQSICGSASNRRQWGQYHHIMNPKTLDSINEIIAVWVIADTALLADALATCLFLVPPKQLQPHFAFEYVLVTKNNQVAYSKNFTGEVFF